MQAKTSTQDKSLSRGVRREPPVSMRGVRGVAMWRCGDVAVSFRRCSICLLLQCNYLPADQ